MDEIEELIAALLDDAGLLAGLFQFLTESEDQVLALIDDVRSHPDPPPTPPAHGSLEFGFVLHWIHDPSREVQGWLDTHHWVKILWHVLEDQAPPSRISVDDYQFIWNAVDRTSVPSVDGTLFGTKRYEQLDPDWLWAFVNYVANLLIPRLVHGLEIPAAGAPPLVAASDTGPVLAIVGDWGTGFYTEDGVECPAQRMVPELDRLPYDYLVHLGDVYYAGTDDRPPDGEEHDNFVSVWPESRPGRSLTLNSNHEMYGGAKGLFEVALEAPAFGGQDGSSIWARSYGPWLVLGLDSARYADAQNGDHMYMDGAIGAADEQDQINWVQQFRDHDGPVMVVTHHNPCDTLSGATNVLFDQVHAALGKMPDLWYWGHVHNAIVYQQMHTGNPSEPVPTKGRCCGHGAVPFGNAWGLQDNDNISYYARTKDPSYPADSPRVLNGYATVQLHPDGTFTETFYEIGRGAVWPPTVVPDAG